MKKFFEMPVVEITVFDVEDVITTSVVYSTDAEVAAEITALIDNINKAGTSGYNGTNIQSAARYDSTSYNW